MASNSLGLDLDDLKISESTATEAEAPAAESSTSAAVTEDASDAPQSPQTELKKKEAPYVNPERVKTGGAARVRELFLSELVLPFLNCFEQDKPTDDELQARMARIREQNEKIKQRRAVRLLHI